MSISKTDALPLGDTPKNFKIIWLLKVIYNKLK